MPLPNFGTWEVYKGDGLSVAFTVEEDGVATDITDYAIMFTAKERATDDDDEAVIQKAAVITDGPNGKALLALTGSDTDIAAGSYAADIELVPDDGEPTTVGGRLVVVQDVRRGA